MSVLNLSALSLILAFNSSSILSFYFFFELTLIPVLILILGWGYQPERLAASFYIFFYTLFGSLPLLIILMAFIKEGGRSFFSHPTQFKRGLELLFLSSAFLIKTPIYFSHIWLPKAHVEAPVAGSMILAGLMLKLGSLGLVYLNFFF
jgi:NADH-ubiquinone oxidoreductase chain 4